MRGSVRKKGATWSYRIELGIVDRKRNQVEKSGFKSRKEADKALNDALYMYNNTGDYIENKKSHLQRFTRSLSKRKHLLLIKLRKYAMKNTKVIDDDVYEVKVKLTDCVGKLNKGMTLAGEKPDEFLPSVWKGSFEEEMLTTTYFSLALMNNMFRKRAEIGFLLDGNKVAIGYSGYSKKLKQFIPYYITTFNDYIFLADAINGMIYRSMGNGEHNMFLVVAKRMKHRGACWSPQGGLKLCKLLCHKVSNSLVETIESLTTFKIPERLQEPSMKPLLSSSKVPKKDGKGYEGKHTSIPFVDSSLSNGRKELINWLKGRYGLISYF